MRDQSRIISTLIMVLAIAVSGGGLAQVRATAPVVDEVIYVSQTDLSRSILMPAASRRRHLSTAWNARLHGLLCLHRSRHNCTTTIMGAAHSELTAGNPTLSAM